VVEEGEGEGAKAAWKGCERPSKEPSSRHRATGEFLEHGEGLSGSVKGAGEKKEGTD
jgi:hypothetical protein